MPYKDLEQAKINKREYHERNKEKILAYQRQYRIINAEVLSQKTKTWQRENPELYKAKTKKWNNNNKEKRKSIVFKNQYGITIDNYNELLEEQSDCCAICGLGKSRLKRPLCVDHDHTTKIVRGLLCHQCNSLLGFANDSVGLLERAINYLSPTKG